MLPDPLPEPIAEAYPKTQHLLECVERMKQDRLRGELPAPPLPPPDGRDKVQ